MSQPQSWGAPDIVRQPFLTVGKTGTSMALFGLVYSVIPMAGLTPAGALCGEQTRTARILA